MKKIIFFALMLLGTLSYAQKLDCSKIKNIKFSAPAFPNEYIIRKDSIEEGYRMESCKPFGLSNG